MVLKVVIVGTGVKGLSCAAVIQEKSPLIAFAEKFNPGFIIGEEATGIWLPFKLGDKSDEDKYDYSKKTWKRLETVWKLPIGRKLGISLVPCIQALDSPMPVSVVSDILYSFQTIDTNQLSTNNKPEWKYGFKFSSFITETSKLLLYYLDKLKANNGIVLPRKLKNLYEIASNFNIINNISDVKAYYLKRVQLGYPMRGIAIRDADIIPEWVELRCGQQQVRVERKNVMEYNNILTVLDNYGHGDSGLTMFYGYALKVADLLETVLAKGLVSKLW